MTWHSSFSYLPTDFGEDLAIIQNQTQRVTFTNNLLGNKVRVSLSNKYSTNPLEIAEIYLQRWRKGHIIESRAVTLYGKNRIRLAPGEELFSDELKFEVVPGERLSVTTYIDSPQIIGSASILWSKTGLTVENSFPGNVIQEDTFETIATEEIYRIVAEDEGPVKGTVFYALTGLQVKTNAEITTVAAFGDSITHMSYWTNPFFRSLCQKYPGTATLLNRGIGGNRLLHDATRVPHIPGEGSLFGKAGVERFEADVVGGEKVDVVFVLEGINDIMHPLQLEGKEDTLTATELIIGHRQLIQVAKKYGAKIYGATILPCWSEQYPADWKDKIEVVRNLFNQWVRATDLYDGVFDYDAAIKDETQEESMKPGTHTGDWLHPNDIGGEIMAKVIEEVFYGES